MKASEISRNSAIDSDGLNLQTTLILNLFLMFKLLLKFVAS